MKSKITVNFYSEQFFRRTSEELKSAINTTNKMGPKIDPCGTPKSIFRKSLNSEPTLVFYFLSQRQVEIKDSDFLWKSKAFNFAISKP